MNVLFNRKSFSCAFRRTAAGMASGVVYPAHVQRETDQTLIDVVANLGWCGILTSTATTW
eukprot:626864-Pelagomonas_calceolata.AAC.4